MRVATVSYNVYKFDELSKDAKEKVKQFYLDGQEEYIFTEDCKEDLKALFGSDTDLDVQYSLSYSQGDGFNIYGKINAQDILYCLKKHNGGTQLEKFENVLTEKEWKTILHYQAECNDIELPSNNRYCYCLAHHIDIADDWKYDLKNYSGFKNINVDVLEKFESLVQDIFSTLCSSYEKWGYNYFYEVEEEDLKEICDANDWEFLSDGKIF